MKILIVDDSKAMRMIVIRTLRQCGISGLQLLEAEDGVQGLEQVEKQQPDLVLSDWNMHNMTGIEFLKNLRERGSDVRFGFVTTECTAGVQEAAAQYNAEFMVTKPFTVKSFQAVLTPEGQAVTK